MKTKEIEDVKEVKRSDLFATEKHMNDLMMSSKVKTLPTSFNAFENCAQCSLIFKPEVPLSLSIWCIFCNLLMGPVSWALRQSHI